MRKPSAYDVTGTHLSTGLQPLLLLALLGLLLRGLFLLQFPLVEASQEFPVAGGGTLSEMNFRGRRGCKRVPPSIVVKDNFFDLFSLGFLLRSHDTMRFGEGGEIRGSHDGDGRVVWERRSEDNSRITRHDEGTQRGRFDLRPQRVYGRLFKLGSTWANPLRRLRTLAMRSRWLGNDRQRLGLSWSSSSSLRA